MSNEEMQRELERLRAEVAALSASRAREAEKTQQDEAATAREESPGSTAEPVGANEMKSQIDELIKLLETEVRDLPTITCLLVFSLGILMGRFMR